VDEITTIPRRLPRRVVWFLGLLAAVTLRHHQATIVITVSQIDRRIRPRTAFGR
jgi:hypothetical protein